MIDVLHTTPTLPLIKDKRGFIFEVHPSIKPKKGERYATKQEYVEWQKNWIIEHTKEAQL